MTTEIRTGQPIKLTAAGAFWYVLMNIALGAGYLAKVPIKRALEQAGLAERTAAEKFWYVLQNIFFGAGYFAKVIAVKALSEATQHDIEPERTAS